MVIHNFSYKILFLYFLKIVTSVIPVWDFNNSSIELLLPFSYKIYDNDNILLKKVIKRINNNIEIKNYLTISGNSDEEVNFENINSTFNEKYGASSYLICPKGKFHPYDYQGKKEVKNSQFTEYGNWDLKCIDHKNGYFLIFYLNNKGSNFISYKNSKKEYLSNYFGDELYDLDLKNYYNNNDNGDSAFKLIYISSEDNYIKLKGASMILNTRDAKPNINSHSKYQKLIINKDYSQAYFDKESPDKFLYYFTYHNISDFSCGYCSSPINLNYFSTSYNANNVIHEESRIEFIDEVKVSEINFIQGTKYAYFEINNTYNNKIYHGFMDIIENKVLFNTDENITKFIPYSDTEMLAVTPEAAFKICIIKDGQNCSDKCPTGNLVLDINGNKCKSESSCDEGKIKLIPNGVCVDLCDENIFIYNKTNNECGLCKDFYPNTQKYKLINTTGCLSEIPQNAENYNSNTHLFLLKCKEGFHIHGKTCISDLEQTECEDGYYLNNSNCLPCNNTRCSKCSKKSNDKKLCTDCKADFIKVNYTTLLSLEFFDCLYESDKMLEKFYKDEDEIYKPCYRTCNKCLKGGDDEAHNCLNCKNGYMFRPGNNPKNNCVAESDNSYIDAYGNFKNLPNSQCPDDAKYKIEYKDKNKILCIYDCKESEDHLYLYNGNCLESCPNNAKNESFKCLVNKEICTQGKNDIYINYNDTMKFVETLAKAYSFEFNYTYNHISLYENKNFTIMIYKNDSCIKDLSIKMPTIHFQNCSKILKNKYNTTELIYAVADKNQKSNPTSFLGIFHPISGIKLDVDRLCNNNLNVSIIENLNSIIENSNKEKKIFDLQKSLAEQGINIFDKENEFFSDICYEFDNPLTRDIPLKDRQKDAFPEATLCDDGCHNEGIDFSKMTATCNCIYRDISNSNFESLFEEIFGDSFKLIASGNLQVLKCKNNFFNHVFNTIGGIISIILILADITFIVLFFFLELAKMKIYIMNLTNNYILCLKNSKKSKENNPPIKRNFEKKKKYKERGNKKPISIGSNFEKSSNLFQNKNDIQINLNNRKKIKLLTIKGKENNNLNIISKDKNMDKKFFKEYLAPSVDDMAYDDAILLDNRKYMEIFCDILKAKQMLINIFIIHDPLKPISIKIIFLILDICCYLVIIGLFFGEDYLSEIYNLEEEDNFFSFFPRIIDKLIYSSIISMIIGYIIDFFFVEEKKIIAIFQRDKNNRHELRQNIAIFIKNILQRYVSFIIIVFIILIFSSYYLLCFNRVYPKTQIEWIKSTIVIFIFIQLISLLKCIYESSLRFMSFRLKSERLYKISKIFD